MIIFQDRDFGKDIKRGVANWMLRFGGLRNEAQQMQMIEWIKYGKDTGGFRLPFYVTEDDKVPADALKYIKEIRLCRHALQKLTDFGQVKWKRVSDHEEEGTIPVDGRKGNTSRRDGFMKIHEEPLKEHFETLRQYACPRATKQVKLDVGIALRDEDVDVEDLPSNYTLRGSYCRYCWDVGFVATSDAKGNFTVEPRTDAEWRGPRTDDEPPPLLPQRDYEPCAFSSYMAYWHEHYPKLRVQKASEDLCSKCFKYVTNMAGQKDKLDAKMKAREEELQEAFDEAKELASEDEPELTLESFLKENPEVALAAQSTPEEDAIAEEIEKITLHVREAQSQRELVNELLAKSKEDALNDVPHCKRTYTFCADYAQNMDVPSFRGEQPGDTYYFSPLSVYVFGVADEFNNPGKSELMALCYPESAGKKGGDNVVAGLMKYLQQRGLLDERKGIGGRLIGVMDNCGGQNKNRMVLRFGALLVELGYFEEVWFVFLIVGHTKNMCDRMFNLMKKNYRQKNIYAVQQLLEQCNKLPMIEAIELKPENFLQYDDFLFDKYYRKLTVGVKKWGIFRFVRDQPSDPPVAVLKVRTSNLPDAEEAEMAMYQPLPPTDDPSLPAEEPERSKARLHQRQLAMREELLTIPPYEPPGLRPIKQSELYNKFRPFVPPEWKDITCPAPPEEVTAANKADKREKSRQYRQKRKQAKQGAKEVAAKDDEDNGDDAGANEEGPSAIML
jgi:hypothetical protein